MCMISLSLGVHRDLILKHLFFSCNEMLHRLLLEEGLIVRYGGGGEGEGVLIFDVFEAVVFFLMSLMGDDIFEFK